MENLDKVLVLITTFLAAFLTWKMVFDFYKVKLHKVFSHLIAVVTASFMFMSSMILFVPQNYQRGATAEIEFSTMSFLSVVVMILVIYTLFKYIPNRNYKKLQEMKKPNNPKASKKSKKNK